MVNWIYITKLEDVNKVCDFFSKKEVIGLDIETGNCHTGLPVFEPWQGDISLIQLSDGKKTVLIDVFAIAEEAKVPRIKLNGVIMYAWDKLRPLFKKLKALLEGLVIKVIHNAKFEQKWLQAKLNIFINKVFDTFLAAQLCDYNDANDPKRAHNLAAVMRRYVGEDLDKTEQVSNWGERPLSEEQKEYAALDVHYSPDLREALLEVIIAKKLIKTAQIEFEVVGVVAKMENVGNKVNREKYEEEIKTIENLRNQAEKALQAKVKKEGEMVQESLFGLPEKDFGEVLLTSSSQMKEALNKMDIPVFAKKEIEQFEAYKQEEKFINSLSVTDKLRVMKERYPKFNYDLYNTYKRAIKDGKGIIQGTGAKALLNVDKKEYDVIGTLKEFRSSEKLMTSYGPSFLNHLRYVADGHERVYANFKQIGAPTGRFSCNNPNLQQIPAGEIEVDGVKHVVKFRETFDFPRAEHTLNKRRKFVRHGAPLRFNQAR